MGLEHPLHSCSVCQTARHVQLVNLMTEQLEESRTLISKEEAVACLLLVTYIVLCSLKYYLTPVQVSLPEYTLYMKESIKFPPVVPPHTPTPFSMGQGFEENWYEHEALDTVSLSNTVLHL